MGKFVIECPQCGRCTEASTGFFAKRKIDCACGYTIHVKTDKMSSKLCPSCGRTVVYDQSKGEDALCPVCHAQVNTRESMQAVYQFTCPSCSCQLSAAKDAGQYTCPLCETVIQVQEQVAKQEIKNKGLASVIKYEGGNDIFVWKHPIEDFNLGSQLIVHESQEAIFFRDGKALDLFGAGRYTLATQNLPLLENLYKLPTNTDEVFHSEVYFINMTTQMGIKWGTDSKVRLFDPSSGLYIELGASGNFNLRVTHSRKLVLKVVGTVSELTQDEVTGSDGYSTRYLVGKFKALIMNKVKSNLARAIKELGINILEIDSYIDILSDKLRVLINETLDEYGLEMPEFYITNVVTPDDDPNFRRLKQQFADRTLLVRQEEILKAEAEAARGRQLVEAQTEAQLQMVKAKGEAEALKIHAEAEAEGYRMQALAEAEEMRAKGYTYQQETARQVGMEAMQNGITGNGSGESGGSMGDIASLGVTLGAMGGVIGMTRDALKPIMGESTELGAGFGGLLAGAAAVQAAQNASAVSMGERVVQNASAAPAGEQVMQNASAVPVGEQTAQNASAASTAGITQGNWDCLCGATGLTSPFCPECGAKRPEQKKAEVWNCSCGQQNIASRFCPECGTERPGAE